MYRAIVLAQDGTGSGTGTGTGEGTGDGPAKGGGGDMLGMLIPFALILVVMYFIMIRPQRKQQKQRQNMLAQMEKNARVVTIGGIYGVVYSIKENEVVLKVDERNDVRITVLKSAIARVIGDEEASADAASGTITKA